MCLLKMPSNATFRSAQQLLPPVRVSLNYITLLRTADLLMNVLIDKNNKHKNAYALILM